MNTITKNTVRLLSLFAFLLSGTFLKSQSIEKITPVFDPPGNYYLTLGAFTDTLHGWVGEPNINKIWFTVDGGYSWHIQKEIGEEKLSDIFFLDYGHGWAVSVLPTEDSSKIYYTEDGGTNWISYTAPLIYTINFVDESTGIGVGKNGIYKTTDGGITWQKKNLDFEGTLLENQNLIMKDNYGYSIGYKIDTTHSYSISYSIIKTTDYGENWRFIYPIPGDFVKNGYFLSENRGFFTTFGDLILVTGEQNAWEDKGTNIIGRWTDVAFFDNDNGFVVGDNGEIAFTRDSGETWEQLSKSSNNYFSKIILVNNSNIGLIIGAESTIVKIKKGGTTEINEIVTIANNFRLLQNYPNPFNPTTIFEYQINATAEITIKIYDTIGKEIITLFEGEKLPGSYKLFWNGTNSFGRKVSSGTYFCRMTSQSRSQTIKVTLLH